MGALRRHSLTNAVLRFVCVVAFVSPFEVFFLTAVRNDFCEARLMAYRHGLI